MLPPLPGNGEGAAGTVEQLRVAVGPLVDRLGDRALEDQVHLGEAEHLAHLLVAEAPVHDVGRRVLELAPEAQRSDAREIDGRVVRDEPLLRRA